MNTLRTMPVPARIKDMAEEFLSRKDPKMAMLIEVALYRTADRRKPELAKTVLIVICHTEKSPVAVYHLSQTSEFFKRIRSWESALLPEYSLWQSLRILVSNTAWHILVRSKESDTNVSAEWKIGKTFAITDISSSKDAKGKQSGQYSINRR